MNTLRIGFVLAVFAFIGGSVLGMLVTQERTKTAHAAQVQAADAQAHAKTCRYYPELKVCQR